MAMGIERRVGLRPLLLGPTLSDRNSDPTLTTLDSHLEAVHGLLGKVYGGSDACQQAQMEFKRFLDMQPTHDGVLCKRSALLFSLSREKEVANYLIDQERRVQGDNGKPTYTQDMCDRVLPFIVPHFMRNSCQAPDAFAVLACVLGEMWEGEKLGNWPLEEGAGERAQ